MAKSKQVYCKTCQDVGWIKDSKGNMIICPKCGGDKDVS